ncbi:AFG1/ZapE family ATPase [Streptomyces sp. NPDC097981]|uniref:AFG1/ZapE family ATPase n=1 Tax=Streptomyces sp. NPDC097981 TaxID=3155428 RepID=UPI00332E0315
MRGRDGGARLPGPRRTVRHAGPGRGHPPPLTEASADGRQRFANLVDVACDRDIRLVLIGAAPLTALPEGQALTRDLDRTTSRLAMLGRPSRLRLRADCPKGHGSPARLPPPLR